MQCRRYRNRGDETQPGRVSVSTMSKHRDTERLAGNEDYERRQGKTEDERWEGEITY